MKESKQTNNMNTQMSEYRPAIVFHPGEVLKEKLQELGLGIKEFAVRTGKPEQTISNVLNEKSSITPEMAVLFEAVTQIPASFWQNKQARYDEYLAKQKRAQALASATEWAKKFPYAKMASAGWVTATRKPIEKAEQLLSFFGIAVKEAWDEYFFNKRLAAHFRISLHGTKDPYALSAWIRQGERLASQQEVPAYDAKKLKKALPLIKSIMTTGAPDFWQQVVVVLNSVGVKVVCVPCLPKVSASGVSRWINNSPIIQVSDRMKRYDIFWFSLWHEIGHILKHGTKYISVENVEYDDRDMEVENEANAFAAEWIFAEEEEQQFVALGDFSRSVIIRFAAQVHTHPSLIAGRLVHKGYLTTQAIVAMQLVPKVTIRL